MGLAFDVDLALLKNAGLLFWDGNAVLALLKRNAGTNLAF